MGPSIGTKVEKSEEELYLTLIEKEAAIALLSTLQYCSVLDVQLYSPALLCEAW